MLRLLDVLTETVHEPMLTINTTPAAIFRSINEEEPPTLLVDEADTIFGPKVAEKNEETRGLLNAGHQRGRYVTRVVGNDHTPHKFATFAMAAIAGIGDLPDTVMDRSVVIRMRRRAEGEKVNPSAHGATSRPCTNCATVSVPGPSRYWRTLRAWSRRCRSRTGLPTHGSPWRSWPTLPEAAGPG